MRIEVEQRRSKRKRERAGRREESAVLLCGRAVVQDDSMRVWKPAKAGSSNFDVEKTWKSFLMCKYREYAR